MLETTVLLRCLFQIVRRPVVEDAWSEHAESLRLKPESSRLGTEVYDTCCDCTPYSLSTVRAGFRPASWNVGDAPSVTVDFALGVSARRP